MGDYYTRRTPDYSPFVVHFIREGRMTSHNLLETGHPLLEHRESTALEKLRNILTVRKIHKAPIPWVPKEPSAVCFTECLWDSLIKLSEGYSSYGLVFSKKIIHDEGGGPALYLRGSIQSQVGNDIPEQILPFIQPFDPEAILNENMAIDYLHEREWRLPSSLEFEYANIEFVIVKTIDDATSIVHQVGSSNLPENKLIPMEVYGTIREAWGGG